MIQSMNFKQQLDKLKQEVEYAKENSLNRRISIDIDKITFYALLEGNIDKYLYENGSKICFVPDQNAKMLFDYLFKYVTAHKDFVGDIDKGLYIGGSYGVGKTVIMTSFCNLINSLNKKRIYNLHSKVLAQEISSDVEKLDKYSKGILYIDDIGKEPNTVSNYGNKINPLETLLTARYENNALTFASGNKKLESFIEHYGGSVIDRMKSMFNVIYLKGESKRK